MTTDVSLHSQPSLVTLLDQLDVTGVIPVIPITDIASNSRQVRDGSAFIALHGSRQHGIDFAVDAVRAGAVVVMYDAQDEYCLKRVPLIEQQIQTHWIGVHQLYQKCGEVVSRFYGDPSQSMKLIGVTGTDGKTTVTHLITQALHQLKKSVASIGTLGYGIGSQLQPGTLTTPDAVTLQTHLHEFAGQGCEYVVMEVSSHALDQYRVSGCCFDVVVLTNLGRDHLDYHGDLSCYAKAKEKLFREFEPTRKVLNLDDQFGARLMQDCESDSVVAYATSLPGVEHADSIVHLIEFDAMAQGLKIRVATPLGEVHTVSPLIGRFNIDNMLACIAALIALGFDQAAIQHAISDLRAIPGRMEKLGGVGAKPTAVIDFAHTEAALSACLRTCREHTRGKLWCVFGCGGDRDSGKRKDMGRVVEELADRIVITDDNPRTEPPDQIVADILSGFKRPGEVSVVHNRQAAIEYALSRANSEDLVLIAGKGHEQYQIIGETRFPFSDSHVVRRVLETSS